MMPKLRTWLLLIVLCLAPISTCNAVGYMWYTPRLWQPYIPAYVIPHAGYYGGYYQPYCTHPSYYGYGYQDYYYLDCYYPLETPCFLD